MLQTSFDSPLWWSFRIFIWQSRRMPWATNQSISRVVGSAATPNSKTNHLTTWIIIHRAILLWMSQFHPIINSLGSLHICRWGCTIFFPCSAVWGAKSSDCTIIGRKKPHHHMNFYHSWTNFRFPFENFFLYPIVIASTTFCPSVGKPSLPMVAVTKKSFKFVAIIELLLESLRKVFHQKIHHMSHTPQSDSDGKFSWKMMLR